MEIILYDCRWKEIPVIPRERNKLRSPVRLLRIFGYSLIIISLLALTVSLGPILIQEISYHFRHRLSSSSALTPNHSSPPFPSEKQREQVKEEAGKYGVTTDFSIVIPKISANAKVIPNVNPADEKEYRDALKKGVGHAAGSKLPGNPGTIYLFAHSTNSPFNISRYNAVFYLLKELETDDQIIIFFAGQKFTYKVTERLITAADDTRWLNDHSRQERLVLQTCWPPGTTNKRLLIIANPV